VIVAGTHSGVGKTTIATGLMAALRRRGRAVGAAKVGPDFIDPGYHALAVGRPSRNLDAWICGPDSIGALALRAGDGCDILVVEGVMGLFDGADDGSPSSTADIAELVGAPVVLVVDASAVSRSIAAVVHGFATFDQRVRVAGLILNRVGSDGHRAMLVEALEPLGIPIVGSIPRDESLVWRDRHLGLVPVAEQRSEVLVSIEGLAVLIERCCDLDAIERIAASAQPVSPHPLPDPRRVGSARIAVATGPAFSFQYIDNLEALEAAGAEIVPFDPLTSPALPERVHALVAGGGFPEVYAAELSANRPLLDDLTHQVDDGMVVWAECGGLLWLAKALDDRAMTGVIPTVATMTDRLTLGYRTATVRTASPFGPAATVLRGHEFHYSSCDPSGGAISFVGRRGTTAGGFVNRRLIASYLHVHLAARPDIAEHFVSSSVTTHAPIY
jgi:cobyrinic acid a,c-diamide synthase